jgi:hypothetical protein
MHSPDVPFIPHLLLVGRGDAAEEGAARVGEAHELEGEQHRVQRLGKHLGLHCVAFVEVRVEGRGERGVEKYWRWGAGGRTPIKSRPNHTPTQGASPQHDTVQRSTRHKKQDAPLPYFPD